MPNPIVGIGAAYQYATVASPTTFTTYAGVDTITFSGDKVATEKTTTMATANGVDTFIGSTQDPGTVDIKAFWIPGDATQTGLETIRLAGLAVQMKATYGTSNSCTFAGIVESITPSVPLDKPARVDIKVKVTGPRTFA